MSAWLMLLGSTGFAALAATEVEAQSILYRPVAPSSGVSGVVDVGYQRVGVGESALHAGQLAVEVEGRARVDPRLELGARWGMRASTVVLDDFGGRARVGLPPLTVFVGTGGSVGDAIALGARLLAGASFALVGVDDLSSNGEHAFAALEGALGAGWTAVDLQARLGLGVAYAGSTAVSGIVRAEVMTMVGESTWVLRPWIGGTIAYATDIAFGGELSFGASGRVDAATLHFGFGVRPWDDPSGTVARLWLAGNLPL